MKTSNASFVPKKSSQASQISIGSTTLSSASSMVSNSSPSDQVDWNAFHADVRGESAHSKRSGRRQEDQFASWEGNAFDSDSHEKGTEGSNLEGSAFNQERSLDSSLFTFQNPNQVEDINKSQDSSVFHNMSINNSNDLGNGNTINDSGFGFGWKGVDNKHDEENNFSTWAEDEFTDLYSTRGSVKRFTFNDEADTFEPINQCDTDQMTSSSSIGNSTISFHDSHVSSKQTRPMSQSKTNCNVRTPRSSPKSTSSSEYRRSPPPASQHMSRSSPKQSESIMGNSVFSARTEDSPTGVADFDSVERGRHRKKMIFSEQKSGFKNREVCESNDQWFDV